MGNHKMLYNGYIYGYKGFKTKIKELIDQNKLEEFYILEN